MNDNRIKRTISRSALWLLLLLISGAVQVGCTRNNGDIGMWFGTWKVTEVTVDDQPSADYGRNVFMKFQNDVVALMRVAVDGPQSHERDTRVGTWREDGNLLLLDFSHTDDSNPDNNDSWLYFPFVELHLQGGATTALTIVSRSGGEVKLRYVDENGSRYGYTLVKQG